MSTGIGVYGHDFVSQRVAWGMLDLCMKARRCPRKYVRDFRSPKYKEKTANVSLNIYNLGPVPEPTPPPASALRPQP